MIAGATGDTASCPLCGVRSCHVHSQYGRTLRDLPWQGVRGRVELRTRRLYCRSGNCRRKIFAERFPNLTVAHGRQTNCHAEALRRIGYALGGEAGFQLASELGIDSSPDTILRMLKRGPSPVVGAQVKVLGVDDWAWKRVNAMEQSWSTWIDTGRSIFCRIESRRVCRSSSRRTLEWKSSAVIAPAPTPRVREKPRRMHRRSLIAFIFSAISPKPCNGCWNAWPSLCAAA